VIVTQSLSDSSDETLEVERPLVVAVFAIAADRIGSSSTAGAPLSAGGYAARSSPSSLSDPKATLT
jgi:hypothetical protein